MFLNRAVHYCCFHEKNWRKIIYYTTNNKQLQELLLEYLFWKHWWILFYRCLSNEWPNIPFYWVDYIKWPRAIMKTKITLNWLKTRLRPPSNKWTRWENYYLFWIIHPTRYSILGPVFLLCDKTFQFSFLLKKTR